MNELLGVIHPRLSKAIAYRQVIVGEIKRRKLKPKPQPGPQENFLSCTADIAIYGGSAGSAKSYGLLMWPLDYAHMGKMRAVIFRRLTPELTNPGALWDESKEVYRYLEPRSVGGNTLEHHFNSGAYIKFAHLEHDDTVHSWDSAQIPLIGFDQLEQFSRYQFFYMHSRNRSMSGVPAQIRAACNPDADSWLAEFLAWWIDQETGYPIVERSGVVRYFIRDNDEIIWADTRQELVDRYWCPDLPEDSPEQPRPISVTFIPGTIFDNPILLQKNPAYLARLKSLPRVECERLLRGNWKIRPAAGLMFQRQWCLALDLAPDNAFEAIVRGWDLAGTQKTESNSPAWTVGVKLGRYRHTKRFCVLDVRRAQVSPAKVEELILRTAQSDGRAVRIALRQDPGQAGKAQVSTFARLLAGFTVHSSQESGDKATRFGPYSAQCEHGNVDIVRGAWYDAYCTSLESFPDGKVKDDADASSTAFERLCAFGGELNVEHGSAVTDAVATGEGDGAPWGIYGNA